MKKLYFDVVIVGGGFAGLKCAHILRDSPFKVLLVEKKKELGDKVCAGGITYEDLRYIPEKFLNFPFKKLFFCYKNKKISFPVEGNIISSINRKKVASFYIEKLKKSKNITLLNCTQVIKIFDTSTLLLKGGEEVNFRYLVGADGSSSMVRKFLRQPTKKLAITIQYKINRQMDFFEIHLHSKHFGNGYLWVFPHKNHTLIGCGSGVKYISSSELKRNLQRWLKRKRIEIGSLKPQAFIINSDYRGYRFGNIFLAGDAAGLASGITGKGILPAFLSGEQIGKEILGLYDNTNLIEEWLKKKKQQERFLIFLKNPWIREIFYPVVIRLLLNRSFSQKMKKLLS